MENSIYTTKEQEIIDYLKGKVSEKFPNAEYSLKKKDLYIWFGFKNKELYNSIEFQEFYHDIISNYLLVNKYYNYIFACGE